MCSIMTMQHSWVLLFFIHSDSMHFTVASRTPLVSILYRLLCFLVLLLLLCFCHLFWLYEGSVPSMTSRQMASWQKYVKRRKLIVQQGPRTFRESLKQTLLLFLLFSFLFLRQSDIYFFHFLYCY